MLTRTVEHRAVSSRSRMSRIVAALVVIAAVSLDGAGASAATTTPRAIVERFHASLLGVMKDADRLGYRGRLATLTPEVARAFHLPIMARIVAGRHWKTFSKDQKKKLV